MISFETLSQYLRWVRVLPRDSSRKEKILCIVSNCFYAAIGVVYLLTSTWFFLSTAETYNEYVLSSIFMLSALFSLVWFVTFLWNKEKFEDLSNKLNLIIINSSSNPVAKAVFEKTNRRIETATKYLHKCVFKIVYPLFIILPIILSTIWYFSSNFDNSSFVQIHPATYPFNWKTPFGYIVCIIVQALALCVSAEIYIVTWILTIGYCEFSINLATNLKDNLREIGEKIAAMKTMNATKRKVAEAEISKKFAEFINSHSEAKEFVECFSGTVRVLVFSYLLLTSIVICSSILSTHLLFNQNNYGPILQTPMAALAFTFYLFVLCDFGQKLTNEFEDVADMLYQLEWEELPLDMQKRLPMVLAVAQKKVYINGFGSITCSRPIFKTIMEAAYSNYTVLRELHP